MENTLPIIELIHTKYGKVGIMAIDQTINGRCCGGVRFSENNGISINEIKKLAENMTLKFGFLKIDPRGGCKLSISIGGEIKYDRKELFYGIGDFLKKFLKNNTLALGIDLGTNEVDLSCIYRGAGFKKETVPILNSPYYTAKSVFIAVDVVREMLGLKNSVVNIGVEGLGKVGIEIVRLSSVYNCKVIAVSNKYHGLYNQAGLNLNSMVRGYNKLGDEFILHHKDGQKISKEELFYAAGLDILIPCADFSTLKVEIAHRLKAKAVVPGANLPAEKDVRKCLFDRGIIYFPDFIANSGGVFGTVLANFRISGKKIDRMFEEGLRLKMQRCLMEAQEKRTEPFSYAKAVAIRGFLELKKQYETNLGKSIFNNNFTAYLKQTGLGKKIIGSYISRTFK
ncbi:MAG: Glu/Leu/Phe/Val dehydrogenase [Candidatus Omnitrophica bacterium]|nr:Glu/Leu/Phe/Val dehydrogenase [Candidatus Omnitrophota bacterium]